MLSRICSRRATFATAARAACFLATLSLTASPAVADRGSDRVETMGGSLSLVVGRVTGDRAELGLVIALKPGWKTYWRTPGDAGIPPRLTLDGGAARDLAVAYPVPHRFGDADAPSLGYSDAVTLPISVRLTDPTRPTRLALAVKLGVCNDICVPVIERLAVDVPSGGRGAAVAIDRAAKLVPRPLKPGAPLAVAAVRRADAAAPAIEVEINPGDAGPVADVFVEAGEDWALPQPTRLADAEGRSRWRIVLADPPAGRAIEGTALTLTIVGASAAGEQVVVVPAQ